VQASYLKAMCHLQRKPFNAYRARSLCSIAHGLDCCQQHDVVVGGPGSHRIPNAVSFGGRWESNGYFQPDEAAAGEPFTMAMPPPNVTGRLHMGHAMFVTLQDIMARYQRMRGRPTLWLPGTDHAGIATQVHF